MNKKILSALLAGALVLSVAGPAQADSFQGTVWSLTYSGSPLPDSDTAHETYQITLGVDTNGYVGPASFIDQVGLKVSSSVFAASLVNAPGGAGDWSLQSGGINNSGCSGSGAGDECANSLSALNGGKGVAINPHNGLGIDYSWVFDITVDNGKLLTAPGTDSIKARFVDGLGAKAGVLMSENFTLSPIPEPGEWALMLSGLGLIGAMIRRRTAALAI